MESNYYLIKSNSFAHLFELKKNKTIETSNLLKSSCDINNLYNNKKILKPKKINVFSKSKTKNEYIKIFTTKLNEDINSDIPKNNIKQSDVKDYKNKNLRNEIIKGNLISSFSDKKFDQKNNLYNGNKQDYILPKIFHNDSYFKTKGINISRSNDDKLKLTMDINDSEKNFRMNSGLMNSKSPFMQRFNKLNINSFMNSSFKNNDFMDDEKNTKTLINLRKEHNSRNALNNEMKESKIFMKKYAKSAILNYLNKKYSSVNFSNISISKSNINDSSKFDINKRDEELSNSLSKKYNNLVSNIKKNNSKIFNFNNSINFNILFSKFGEKLDRNKVIYDINKALYLDKKSNIHLKGIKKS